jgi:hypothetical protein
MESQGFSALGDPVHRLHVHRVGGAMWQHHAQGDRIFQRHAFTSSRFAATRSGQQPSQEIRDVPQQRVMVYNP